MLILRLEPVQESDLTSTLNKTAKTLLLLLPGSSGDSSPDNAPKKKDGRSGLQEVMTILLTQTKYLVTEWEDMRMLGIGGQLIIFILRNESHREEDFCCNRLALITELMFFVMLYNAVYFVQLLHTTLYTFLFLTHREEDRDFQSFSEREPASL